MNKNKVGEERKWRVETAISIISLLVSIGALVFTVLYNLMPGTVQPYEPAGYGIIRGVDPFPSDHLVIPLEWENDGRRTVLIRYPQLTLRELNNDGKETGKDYKYFLAGEYKDISTASFREPYSVKRSFTLDPIHCLCASWYFISKTGGTRKALNMTSNSLAPKDFGSI